MAYRQDILKILRNWADSFEISPIVEDSLIRDPSKHRKYYRMVGKKLVVEPDKPDEQ